MTQFSGELFAHSFDSADDPLVAVAEKPDPQTIDRTRPIVVTGAAGLVGTRTCSVLAVVRDTAKAAEKLGHLRIEIRSGDIRDVESMQSALRGAGALVHLAAIAIEKKGESYADTNTKATEILLDACRTEAVSRIVYMSQNGADSTSRFPFLRSKGMAQDAVVASNTRWTVLKPSVIFGPDDEFVNVLARLVRLSPIVYLLPGGGTARLAMSRRRSRNVSRTSRPFGEPFHSAVPFR
jgi:NADH dehydrogenase